MTHPTATAAALAALVLTLEAAGYAACQGDEGGPVLTCWQRDERGPYFDRLLWTVRAGEAEARVAGMLGEPTPAAGQLDLFGRAA